MIGERYTLEKTKCYNAQMVTAPNKFMNAKKKTFLDLNNIYRFICQMYIVLEGAFESNPYVVPPICTSSSLFHKHQDSPYHMAHQN